MVAPMSKSVDPRYYAAINGHRPTSIRHASGTH